MKAKLPKYNNGKCAIHNFYIFIDHVLIHLYPLLSR